MNQAFIGLGTNIEPRADYIDEALLLLQKHEKVRIKQKSSIYETKPVGYTEQADFLNLVIEIETELSAFEILDVCQDIELKLGRERSIRFGPRTIDLDILLFNQENIETERLSIPHARMHERAFVLVPLAEIAQSHTVPKWDKQVIDLLNELPEQEKNNVWKWHSPL